MNVEIIASLDQVACAEWNALNTEWQPFLRHEFLSALEHNQCVGPTFGWLPRHVLIRDQGLLVAAAPVYVKYNSYGELVFDFSWADAYQRAGLNYYPKLVCAIPYTPATGHRLLIADLARLPELRTALFAALVALSQSLQVSSTHILFPTPPELSAGESFGFMPRLGCQFHWQNQGFADFSEFIATFRSEKRKKTLRERRKVLEAGIEILSVLGSEATLKQIDLAHDFYASIFERKSGFATLNVGFFHEVCHAMGDQVLFIFALHHKQYIACSIFFQSAATLYGRFWGCRADYDSLHFELCYYQGIDYCLAKKLKNFEPGAQGEHKIARGFLPTATWSSHWISDARFKAAIENFLRNENAAMQNYMHDCAQHSPYRETQ